MKEMKVETLFTKTVIERVIIVIASIILIYFIISLYFINHFFPNTIINGVDVSFKAYDQVDFIFKNYADHYELQLYERNGYTEKILGHEIGMKYNEKNSISLIYAKQPSIQWLHGLFKGETYYIKDLYDYNNKQLTNKISNLDCLNRKITYPKNVSFQYTNGSYKIIKEVYGNQINEQKLKKVIKYSILMGNSKLDLEKMDCYINPKYTTDSKKTYLTRELLNRYVKTKITYLFGSRTEVLDGYEINKWLRVNDNLDIVLNETAVMKYVLVLCNKYDTVGTTRNFKTSTGKRVEVKGGLYGWKINVVTEIKAIIDHIKQGDIKEREPLYLQKAWSREEDDIGNTYVEINITKQHLWFYKNGKLVTHGPIVTGNPNRGHETKVGTFMLNYKQKGTTLRGPGYEAGVTYWMPFYGNIGIHDATWRSSFGGEIYKRRGSHGCVNAPLYLAKTIYENIEEGTPIICYEE